MEELRLALSNAQQELASLPDVKLFCDEDEYQDNLELKWYRQELEENITRYKLDIELSKN
jgi:hypothetical protein